jgi:hypothetical protein
MLTIRTSKCNSIIKKSSSALFLASYFKGLVCRQLGNYPETAFEEIGARTAFSGITLPRTGLIVTDRPDLDNFRFADGSGLWAGTPPVTPERL